MMVEGQNPNQTRLHLPVCAHQPHLNGDIIFSGHGVHLTVYSSRLSTTVRLKIHVRISGSIVNRLKFNIPP